MHYASRRRIHKRLGQAFLAWCAWGLCASVARADEPITLRTTWSGSVDFYATGATMAIDGPDADTNVDMITQPATVTISSVSVPSGSTVEQAYLYWSGTIGNTDCVPPVKFDDAVDFTPPGGIMPVSVQAEMCYCSTADATSYDVQVCRADVTALIAGGITGDYTVDKFAASIGNGATDSASFSIVVVYRNSSLPPRDIALYDGVEGLSSSAKATSTFSLGGIRVDTPAQGDLTWYTIEGDVGGGSPGMEQVVVTGNPGGASLTLFDPINPANNPMNRTINTTIPPQTGTVGVDIDRFDISGALTAGDTSVDMLYSAHTDKWWIAYNIVGINVFEPVFGVGSNKTGVLHNDADGNGVPTVGDTLRYTIHLNNTGTDAGTVKVIDPIPSAAATWSVVNAGGGMNFSTPTQLEVRNVSAGVQASADIVFDMIIKDVPDQSVISNVATFDATPDGDQGTLTAPDFIVRRDGDKDFFWDNDDNCPNTPNTSQLDTDKDGLGDSCDPCAYDAANDADTDGACADDDNCPVVSNSDQNDNDSDGAGDVCDDCPLDAANDEDTDGVCGDVDNCAKVPNSGQEDTDKDGIGDACDDCLDVDADMACDNVDNCLGMANPGQMDSDGDGLGDACDDCVGIDDDGDGVCESNDNCPGVSNGNQMDSDGDGRGDKCDSCRDDPNNDLDSDGVCGDADNCPAVANTDQKDEDGDGIGDACDVVERPPTPPATDEGGCDCRVAGAAHESTGAWGFFAILLAGLTRRMRRSA
jgi:uncharacterized repeat protein (TIGR01451 family)/MYXO-CTERM domain-containing protein